MGVRDMVNLYHYNNAEPDRVPGLFTAIYHAGFFTVASELKHILCGRYMV